jgi:hypothetical protein
MTEDEARAALRAFHAIGDIEQWLAEQPWEPATRGWMMPADLHGWRFRVEPARGGVRVVMVMREGEAPADWIVPAAAGHRGQ